MGGVHEQEMLDLLNIRYARTGRNGKSVFRRFSRAEHVPWGLQLARHRICDYVAVDMQANGYQDGVPYRDRARLRAPIYHGHEVKVSRSDWLRELADPTKAETFREHMHCWWLVVPDAAIVRDDLPDGWGLMVSHGRSVRVAVHAAINGAPAPMPAPLVGALIRAVTKTEARIAAAPLSSASANGLSS